jgi:radical SAM protein with 4Fe4S-binding SPASM domain
MSDKPLCLAPFNSILIDIDKKILPCAAFDNMQPNFGNLHQQNIVEIVNGDAWDEVRSELAEQRFPKGCSGCAQRHNSTGWSLRLNYQDNGRGINLNGWRDGRIRHLELSGSNVCNLACLQCSSQFSTAWFDDAKKLYFDWTMVETKGDPDNIIKNLSMIDLSALHRVDLKGGEPTLNPENIAVLEYLEEKNVLRNVEIFMTTNGTVINDRLLELLSKAKFVMVLISIDGPGKLNEYIRFGRNETASQEVLERNIQKYSKLPRVRINMITAVMAYNVLRLVDLRDWWLELANKNGAMLRQIEFNLIVTHPEYLSVRVLSKPFRDKVAEFLQASEIRPGEFNYVITTLKDEYLGAHLHNQWVDYTSNLDRVRNNSLLDVEPSLANEFKKDLG